ncbi:MAG: DedA family protein [Sandaracinaceae bacterium]
MMDGLLLWLQSTGGPLPYVVLGLASLLEYVFPPFPGDTVTLFGVFLAATAGWSPVGVYAVLNVGAVGGGMLAYGFGRWLAERQETKPPRFLRSERAQRALASAVSRFERHGAAYLALNRFLPAMRAFFFIGAGLARLPAWKVALYGAVSALLWNALIFAVGWTVGDNFERLLELSQTYSKAAFLVIGLACLVFAARWWVRRRRGASSETDEPSQGSGTTE